MCGGAELLWAEPTLRFWSYRDGTGDVERLLGSHLRFERGHPAADQNDDSTEICMELKAAGPRHEGEIAEHGEGGVLLLTDFSRECAKLWREFFGTRFGSRPSRRKDVGRRFEEKLVGSLKDVRVQHNVAVKRLLKDARLDEQDPAAKKSRCTIFGFRRAEVDPIQAEDPAEKNEIVRFHRTDEGHPEGEVRAQRLDGLRINVSLASQGEARSSDTDAENSRCGNQGCGEAESKCKKAETLCVIAGQPCPAQSQ